MSLRFATVTSGPATAVADTGSKVAVGFANGSLRVFSRTDFVLEREIQLGKAVTQAIHVPETELVAVICDQRCTIHNLASRKAVAEVDSRSAKFLSSTTTVAHRRNQESVLIVGSSYKVRILRFVNSQLVKTTVIDTPDRQKLRSLGSASSLKVFAILGSYTPVLWKIDLSTAQFRPMLALDPRVFGKNSHKFSMTGTGAILLIVASTGGQLVRIEPLKTVEKWENTCFTGASSIRADPVGIQLGLVSSAPRVHADLDSTKLLVLNLFTGTVLAEYKGIKPLSETAKFGLRVGNEVVVTTASLTVDYITQLGSTTEAVSLAYALAPDMVTEQIREIERKEAVKLFANSEVDEAMRIFLTIEEQETPEKFANYETVLPIIEEYLDCWTYDNANDGSDSESPRGDANNNEPGSSKNSVFSVKTARSTKQYHPLDSTVAYLLYTRRKFRLGLATATEKTRLSESALQSLDTSLFRSYMIMGSPLVVPLLRSKNHCDPETVRSLLLARGKWRELVWFLRSLNQPRFHRQALGLLTEHGEPAEAIVSYLEKLDTSDKENLDIVLEYAKPIVSQSPDLAERLFYEERKFNSNEVQKWLDSIDTTLGTAYAKFRVLQFRDNSSPLHCVVARLLAAEFNNIPPGNEKDDRGTKLLQFLSTSGAVDPKVLVNDPIFPPRARAVLYEKLGDFEHAIDVLLNEVHDLKATQALAESHMCVTYLFNRIIENENSGDNKNVSSSAHTQLVECLNTAAVDSDLEMSHVLAKLPQSIKLIEIGAFLQNFLAKEGKYDAQSEINEVVNHRVLAEYSIQLNQFKRKKFSVTSTDACTVCHKRIGRALTAVTDEGLVHYGCMKML